MELLYSIWKGEVPSAHVNLLPSKSAGDGMQYFWLGVGVIGSLSMSWVGSPVMDMCGTFGWGKAGDEVV